MIVSLAPATGFTISQVLLEGSGLLEETEFQICVMNSWKMYCLFAGV